jgi:hypothetical protein
MTLPTLKQIIQRIEKQIGALFITVLPCTGHAKTVAELNTLSWKKPLKHLASQLLRIFAGGYSNKPCCTFS